MFDRTFIQALPRNISVTTNVTERRAPTDESVRLLREMEAEARNEVIASVRLDNCPVDCVIQGIRSFVDASTKFRVLAHINGKRIVLDHTAGAFEKKSPEHVLNDIRDALAVKIAAEVLFSADAAKLRELFNG